MKGLFICVFWLPQLTKGQVAPAFTILWQILFIPLVDSLVEQSKYAHNFHVNLCKWPP